MFTQQKEYMSNLIHIFKFQRISLQVFSSALWSSCRSMHRPKLLVYEFRVGWRY